MKCSISTCNRESEALVTFRFAKRAYAFCGFHAFNKQGQLRWDARDVRNVLLGKRKGS